MEEEELGRLILTAALKVHRALGPGLLESVYETCLAHELLKVGVSVDRQLSLPVIYDGVSIGSAYKIDLLVGGLVIVEVKAVDRLIDVHQAQLLSYLKLGGYRLGYLLNFNVTLLKDGMRRLVNGL